MPVYELNKTFTNPLDGSPTDWPLANIGDPVDIVIDISVKTYAIASLNSPMTLNNNDGFVEPGVITGGDFSKLKIGDTVNVSNYVAMVDFGTYTIIDKPSNSVIILNIPIPGIVPATNHVSPEVVVSLVRPITALSYKWNWIENGEATNWISKVDGSVQIAQVTNLNPAGGGTNIPMAFLGPLDYRVGTITIDEIALDTTPVYQSLFRIKHSTFVTPFMLADQWDDLQNEVAPSYLFNQKSLKFVSYFDARYNLTDPNNHQTLQADTTLGNIGWFNENWNTGLTDYHTSNLAYGFGNSPVTPLPAVQLQVNPVTKFQFDIDNTIDSPFVSGSTKLILNFAKAPNDAGEYTAKNRDLRHNFVWETVTLTVGTTPTGVNGDNFADPAIKSLANVKATFVSSSKIQITGRFEFDQIGIDVFEESNEPRYLFWVSIQNHSLLGAFSDRVSLLVDKGAAYYQTLFPNLITLASKIIPHPVADYPDAFNPSIEMFTEDELVAYTSIEILDDVPPADVVLTRYTASILIKNINTNEDFVLESKTIQLPATPILSSYQLFNISQNRPIHIPLTEIRKPVLARRDLLGRAVYEFAYPFLVRWEYWQQAVYNANFFDPLQVNNGNNQNWIHYLDSQWTLTYRFELAALISGVPNIYTSDTDFKVFDRNLPSENTTCVIETFDLSGNPLTNGGDKFILGYDTTTVKATFTNTIDFLDPAAITVVIGIEIFEKGGGGNPQIGGGGKRRMSSKYDSDSDTWFIPLSGETRVKISSVPFTVIVAETNIDFTKLDLSEPKYKLTARIYGDDLSTSPGNELLYGQNYLGDQEVFLIPTNPVYSETIPVDPIKIDCCHDLVWNVLASSSSNFNSDPLKNDKNTFYWWFNALTVTAAKLWLIQPDGSEIDLEFDSNYGVSKPYGFFINGQNESFVGYDLDWHAIMVAGAGGGGLGAGRYQLRCEYETVFGDINSKYSDVYCLQEWTQDREDGTLRIEYYQTAITGLSRQDDSFKDYGTLQIYNQHRFDGYFMFNKSVYTKEYIQYENGQRDFVNDEQEPEYKMELKPIPTMKHDVLRTDILQANKILVTDYNRRNIDTYYQRNMKCTSGYEPKWYPMKSKLSSLELTFQQGYNNLKKHRS